MMKYLQSKGRINRTELAVLSLAIILSDLIVYLIWGSNSKEFLWISLILFLFYSMQCAKRYHDLNKWGINGFVWWVIPFLNIYNFFQLYFGKGTLDSNKYGAPSTFSLKGILNSKTRKNGEGGENAPITPPEFRLGEFSSYDFPEEHRNNNFYFYEYTQPDGEWVEIDETICKIRIGESLGYIINIGTVKATKPGVLEWVCEKDEPLTNGKSYYRLHRKGEYQNENSIENFEYLRYFKGSGRFDKWLVDDGSCVKVGDPILQVYNKEFQTNILYAQKSGYLQQIEPDKIGDLIQGELMYIIRETDDLRIKERYVNIPEVIIDEFSNSTIIKWSRISSRWEKSDCIVSKSDDSFTDLGFSFCYIDNSDQIVFYFNPKQIKPRQFDTVSLLFENGEQIDFELASNPINSRNTKNDKVLEYRAIITEAELDLFATNNFKKWKISLVGDNKEILGGETSSDAFYRSKRNIQIVIQKFAKDYIDLVKQNIPDYQPTLLKPAAPVKSTVDFCFVYLMHDTSNDYYKIGISNNPEYRERTLQSEKPTIEMVKSKKFPVRKIAESIEKALHQTYSEKRLRGEWFELNEEDVKHITQTLN